MENLIEAPVLLLMFNRYEDTKQVFDKIREAKIKKLYLACDGPRKGNQRDLDEQAKLRLLPKLVDWDCEVHTLFRESNLGCGRGVSSAISWAFEHEDRLIIMEDDCVPSLPWFTFCNHCLEKYKADTRVWTINGRSQNEKDLSFGNLDYVFSIYHHCWGWATWKRVWDGFDLNNTEYERFKNEGGFENVCRTKEEVELLTMKFDQVFSNPKLTLSSWAFPFDLYCMSNRGLAITPRENLSQNVGKDGTHSSSKQQAMGNVFYGLIASETYTFNREPLFVVANAKYDYVHFTKHIKPMWSKPSLALRIKRRLSGLFGKKFQHIEVSYQL
jgi:hypothetical protein